MSYQEVPVAIDTETTGLDWKDETLCVSAGRPTGESLFINLGYRKQQNLFGFAFGDEAGLRDRAVEPMTIPEARAALWQFIGEGRLLAFHNGSFDIPRLIRAGLITSEELARFSIFDTMVMARCTGPHDRVSLEKLVEDYELPIPGAWIDEKKNRSRMADMPIDRVDAYSRADAVITAVLAERMLKAALGIYPEDAIDEDGRWVALVAGMQVRGLLLDRDRMLRAREAKEGALADLLSAINKEIRPFRIKSPSDRKAILAWVQEGLGQGRFLKRTASGAPSVDEESLLGLSGPAAESAVGMLVAARHLEKEISTWIDGVAAHMAGDGRVHPLYTAAGTITNRLSCRNPNAQAFPSLWFDTCFRAEEGFEIVQVDYSQAELRLAAMFAGENALAEEFVKPDADPHMATARLMFGENATKEDRQIAKSSNFLSIYGGGPFRLMEQAGVSEDKARELLNMHKRALPAIARARKSAENVWLNRGYLRTLGEKRIYMRPSDKERSYKAFNALIQPAVAELIKKAMLAIDAELGSRVRLICQVHDSVVAEVPIGTLAEDTARMRELMRDALPAWMSERTTPRIVMHTDVKMRKTDGAL